jgi:hypothetical protein
MCFKEKQLISMLAVLVVKFEKKYQTLFLRHIDFYMYITYQYFLKKVTNLSSLDATVS